MKKFISNSSLDAKLFDILLSPSSLSGFLAGIAAIGFVAFVIISANYRGSNTELQVFQYQASQSTIPAQTIGHALDSNNIVSNLPLLLFWALVGFVVYLFAINIVSSVKGAAELKNEIENYTNLNRRQIVLEVLQKLLIRLIVLLVWVPYINLFFHQLVPYVATLGVVASLHLLSVTGVSCTLLALIVLFVGLHVHAILLRLLVLKPRVFGATYTDF